LLVGWHGIDWMRDEVVWLVDGSID
jgi:hypothetical protein